MKTPRQANNEVMNMQQVREAGPLSASHSSENTHTRARTHTNTNAEPLHNCLGAAGAGGGAGPSRSRARAQGHTGVRPFGLGPTPGGAARGTTEGMGHTPGLPSGMGGAALWGWAQRSRAHHTAPTRQWRRTRGLRTGPGARCPLPRAQSVRAVRPAALRPIKTGGGPEGTPPPGACWGGGLGCLPLAAPIGLSPLPILTLCGPERVLVVSTEPTDDLSCLTTLGVGCPRDGPLTRCIQTHTPSPCGVCRLQH